MLRLEKTGNWRAALVNRLLDTRERLIGAILTGNNVVNIAASSLATGVLLNWFGDVGVLYATVIMTVVVVVFTEVLPKTLAINAPDRIALLVARPISWTVRLLGPCCWASRRWCVGFCACSACRSGSTGDLCRPRGAARAVDLLHHEGGVEKHDRDMFSGLLDLRDLVVSDVMIHRTEMITVCADDPPEEVVKEVLEAGDAGAAVEGQTREHHRHPARQGSVARDPGRGGDLAKIDVKAIARPPWFVPDIRPLSEQLKAFRRRKTPLRSWSTNTAR